MGYTLYIVIQLLSGKGLECVCSWILMALQPIEVTHFDIEYHPASPIPTHPRILSKTINLG